MERWRDTNVQDLSIIIDELREEMIPDPERLDSGAQREDGS